MGPINSLKAIRIVFQKIRSCINHMQLTLYSVFVKRFVFLYLVYIIQYEKHNNTIIIIIIITSIIII